MNKKRIAIIGSGISGLSAAFLLSNKFDVCLYEKENNLGGHTRTVNFIDNHKNISIDTGFIVFNDKNYPDLLSFFNELGVYSEDSNMSFSVSSKNTDFEYGGSNLNSLFGQRKNLFSISFYKLVIEILRLYKVSKKINTKDKSIQNITIEDFLNKNSFSENLRELHIYPMISSIWSSNSKEVKKFPLFSFINFFSNHGLFDLKNRPQWKYVKNGSYNYIKKLLNKKLFTYKTNSKIKKIIRGNNIIKIVNEKNETFIFDKLVIATHADQAIEMLDTLLDCEKKLLSSFKYSTNKAFLHSDENYMPKRKKVWSSWNFLKQNNEKEFTVTYWMNKLQNIQGSKNYFVTINPKLEPKKIIDQVIFEHPIFTLDTHNAQKELYKLQGNKNTYYCGSYFGYGFHEDGIQSATKIAELLNIELPWKRDKNFINRLS